MHALHKILVYVPEVPMDIACSQADMVLNIRDYAANMTEGYQGYVFDWRETDTAGRWSQIFPENVLLGSEGTSMIERELLEAAEAQKNELEESIQSLAAWQNGNVPQMAHNLWNIRADSTPDNLSEYLAPYMFLKIGKLVYGEYTFDSCFYDTCANTARITEQTLEKVNAAPSEWALVLFDYHI